MNAKTHMQLPLVNGAENQPVPQSRRQAALTARRAADRKKLDDLIGQVFGRLTVAYICPCNGHHVAVGVWCACGEEKEVRLSHLRTGETVSCGCLAQEKCRAAAVRHGHYSGRRATKAADAYHSMMRRCYAPRNASFRHYASRGIVVCPRWVSGEGGRSGFECFLADLGDPPSAHLSLDRINNDAGYSPANCRWATSREQANNRQNTRVLEHGGLRLSCAEWSRRVGWPRNIIFQRLAMGWSTERTLTQEPRKKK